MLEIVFIKKRLTATERIKERVRTFEKFAIDFYLHFGIFIYFDFVFFFIRCSHVRLFHFG